MQHVGLQFPIQKLNIRPLHWKHGVLTTAPQERFPKGFLITAQGWGIWASTGEVGFNPSDGIPLRPPALGTTEPRVVGGGGGARGVAGRGWRGKVCTGVINFGLECL